jgi:ABC-2 type transport system ATP-binding protein
MEAAIVITDLTKQFGDLTAVKEVSFTVRRGQVYSLLGPNGAGKSTTISMICGLLRPDTGRIQVMDYDIAVDPKAVRASLGVVPQEIALYDDLTARENLVFWGKMYNLRGAPLQKRVDEVLDLIDLADRQKDRVSTFSGGMKRRVNIGVALMHTPDVIIMDEPTVGIDPQSRRHIMDGVITLNQAGVTILYTTHYMEEAQELSDFIAIMDQGEIIAQGTHEELVKIVGEKDRIEVQLDVAEGDGTAQVLESWRLVAGVEQIQSENGVVTAVVDDSNLVLPAMFEAAAANHARITTVEIQEPNLETVFLHLTGRALRD